jgi:hypothetical protein
LIELVDPRGPREAPPTQLARRPRPSEVKKIGFLSNEKEFMTGPHFEGYGRILSQRFRDKLGVTAFHYEVKPVLSRPAPPGMLERFEGCDIVLTGLAK